MQVNIKDLLSANPNYLIAAVLLAEDGNREPLIEIAGSEGDAYKILKNAKAYGHNVAIYPPSDFPISLNNGEIVKMPERVAGLILAGKTWFAAMNSPFSAKKYGQELLKTLSVQSQKSLLTKMMEILEEPKVVEPPLIPFKKK